MERRNHAHGKMVSLQLKKPVKLGTIQHPTQSDPPTTSQKGEKYQDISHTEAPKMPFPPPHHEA